MAGGTWTTQNKVRPGVYVNVASNQGAIGKMGERGITALALALSWGEPGVIMKITPQDDVNKLLGVDLEHPTLLPVREALKRAGTLLLYRLNEGVKAAVTNNGLQVTAKYGGVRGNDLSIVIEKNIENAALFDVKTLLNGTELNKQTVGTAEELVANDYVQFQKNGAEGLKLIAGMPLTGGLTEP